MLNTDEDITRAVDWLYRTRVKEPKDSLAEIAAETNLSESEIDSAIKDADQLLMIGPPND